MRRPKLIYVRNGGWVDTMYIAYPNGTVETYSSVLGEWMPTQITHYGFPVETLLKWFSYSAYVTLVGEL